MKVLREILRLRKQDKEDRDEQDPCSTFISGPWKTPAHRKQRRRRAQLAANFGSLKEDWTRRASIILRSNPLSMNSSIGAVPGAQPFIELRPASPARDVANRNRDGPLLTDQDHQPLAARDTGVERFRCSIG